MFIIGFPLVYSDTGTYLRSAFDGYVPFDRPYWYGPFVHFTSLGGATLWGVAIAQSLLCAFYVLLACMRFLDRTQAIRTHLVICTTLMLVSSISWYAGQLIPDIFTAIGILAVLEAVLSGARSRLTVLFHLSIVVLCCLFHTSNLVILPLAALALAFMAHRDIAHRVQQWFIAVLILVTSWGGTLVANALRTGEAFISHASPVFMVGRMVDMGMLGPYLNEHCDDRTFKLCAYKDSLPPNGQEMLWSDKSPVQREGGWMAVRHEYDAIVKGSFTEPRYLLWHAYGSLISTADQLIAWEIGEAIRSDWYRSEYSPPYTSIARYLPAMLGDYLASMQNGGSGELSMRIPDLFYRIGLSASLIIIAAWMLIKRNTDAALSLFATYSVTAVTIGAWACATFSTALPRYLARDSWLIVLAAILVAIRWWTYRTGTRADAMGH
jgi:hypothetical protein